MHRKRALILTGALGRQCFPYKETSIISQGNGTSQSIIQQRLATLCMMLRHHFIYARREL